MTAVEAELGAALGRARGAAAADARDPAAAAALAGDDAGAAVLGPAAAVPLDAAVDAELRAGLGLAVAAAHAGCPAATAGWPATVHAPQSCEPPQPSPCRPQAAIAAAAGFATSALRRARPTTRYAVLCAAMGAMLLALVTTFLVLRFPAATPLSAASAVASSIAPVAGASAGISAGSSAARSAAEPFWFLWLVRIWLSGVAVFGLRSISGWAFAQRLRRFKTQPAAAAVVCAAGHLCERLGIRRAVRVVNTAATDVPATLGWLRPVVLLPISAFTALTPEQIGSS